MVCDLPSKFNFVLRSSPIICLLDAVFVVGRLSWYTVALKSPRAAITRLIRRRFYDTQNYVEENSLANLQKNTTFRLCVFVLGALPQSIKLYAMTGLPWTKVWGSTFLGSFVLVELLVMTPRKSLHLPSPNTPQFSAGEGYSLSRWIGIVAVFISFGFSLFFFTIAFATIVSNFVGEISWWHFIILLVFIIAETLCLSFPRRESLVALSYALFAPTTMLFSLNSTISLPLAFNISLVGKQGTALLLVLTGLSVIFALGLIIAIIHRLFRYVSPNRAKFVDFGVGFYFLMSNILAALLYYKVKYNPEGTIKPAWADQLG